jgi:hypothetical protein
VTHQTGRIPRWLPRLLPQGRGHATHSPSFKCGWTVMMETHFMDRVMPYNKGDSMASFSTPAPSKVSCWPGRTSGCGLVHGGLQSLGAECPPVSSQEHRELIIHPQGSELSTARGAWCWILSEGLDEDPSSRCLDFSPRILSGEPSCTNHNPECKLQDSEHMCTCYPAVANHCIARVSKNEEEGFWAL